MKNPDQRPTPQELYDTDPFLQAAKRTPVDLEQWAVSMMERHNRRSHLAPQLSPATKALLRGEGEPTPRGIAHDRTPTAGNPYSASEDPYSRPPVSRTQSSQSAAGQSMNLPIRQAPSSQRLEDRRPGRGPFAPQ